MDAYPRRLSIEPEHDVAFLYGGDSYCVVHQVSHMNILAELGGGIHIIS